MTRVPAQAGNRASRTEHYPQWWEHSPEWNAVTSASRKRRDSSFYNFPRSPSFLAARRPVSPCEGAGVGIWDAPDRCQRVKCVIAPPKSACISSLIDKCGASNKQEVTVTRETAGRKCRMARWAAILDKSFWFVCSLPLRRREAAHKANVCRRKTRHQQLSQNKKNSGATAVALHNTQNTESWCHKLAVTLKAKNKIGTIEVKALKAPLTSSGVSAFGRRGLVHLRLLFAMALTRLM